MGTKVGVAQKKILHMGRPSAPPSILVEEMSKQENI